jgi:hypothetical protein
MNSLNKQNAPAAVPVRTATLWRIQEPLTICDNDQMRPCD